MDVQKYLSNDIFENLKSLIAATPRSLDSNVTYIGEVIKNDDPKKLQRVKVNVFGVYDSFSESDIPWALKESSFTDKDLTQIDIPVTGSMVSVRFDNGDVHKPIYNNNVINVIKSDDDDYPDGLIFYKNANGDMMKINKKTGEFQYEHNSGSKFTINADGKIAMGKGGVEFLDLFDQLLTKLIAATTPTMLGPQFLSCATDQSLALIKTDLLQIKGKL